MNTEEKLKLIDDARYKFAETIRALLSDEGLGTDFKVDVSFYSSFREYTSLLDAAKNLGWEFAENDSKWYVSRHNFGETTVFFK